MTNDTEMKCDCCKQDTDAVFIITVLSLGEKEVCAKCYLRMLPNPDRTVRINHDSERS